MVLEAASFTSSAQRDSNLSSSSISRAIVTQSLVTCGIPYHLSKITFLHFGHIVKVTVLATVSIQANIFALSSSQYFICFAIIQIV